MVDLFGGGFPFSGAGSAAGAASQPLTAMSGDAEARGRLDESGNNRSEGIVINESFKFDHKNPVHIGGVVLFLVFAVPAFIKWMRS